MRLNRVAVLLATIAALMLPVASGWADDALEDILQRMESGSLRRVSDEELLALPTLYRTETRTVVDPTPTVTVEEEVVVTRTAEPATASSSAATRSISGA